MQTLQRHALMISGLVGAASAILAGLVFKGQFAMIAGAFFAGFFGSLMFISLLPLLIVLGVTGLGLWVIMKLTMAVR